MFLVPNLIEENICCKFQFYIIYDCNGSSECDIYLRREENRVTLINNDLIPNWMCYCGKQALTPTIRRKQIGEPMTMWIWKTCRVSEHWILVRHFEVSRNKWTTKSSTERIDFIYKFMEIFGCIGKWNIPFPSIIYRRVFSLSRFNPGLSFLHSWQFEIFEIPFFLRFVNTLTNFTFAFIT